MNKHIIFGISGRAQSGKTTLADHIISELSYGGKHDTLMPVYQINFATYLKKMMEDLYKIPHRILYEDDAKNEKTHIFWEDCPPVKGVLNGSGLMTGRELMEYFGAFIRQLDPAGWLNALAATIDKAHTSTVFLIPDVRAPNEVALIKSRGGKVIRLTNNPLNRDTEIERLLDELSYDWSNFDAVIDNTNLSLKDKNQLGLDKFIEFFGSSLV